MKDWWKERIAYQIYPRSFQDSNGDGIGDIPGIISRLDEIKELGAGIIWLSPVYKSPDADNGYDISDYRAIDPKYGTMEDMERLFEEAKKRDIRIIMDLVINHTSDEHEWFVQSRDPKSPYRDYYIWRPGKGGKDPHAFKNHPNNWTGFFDREVWQYDEKSGDYYLRLFNKKQPDLNYRNPKVIQEIKDIMRFWLDKGASGFRCDVINIIYKTSFDNGKGGPVLRGKEHYKSQHGCHQVLKELRRDVLDKYDCFTVGETVMVDLEEAKLLCDENRKELNMLFYFDHLEVDRRVSRFIPKKFKAKKLLKVITKWQKGLEWNALYLENHDQSRIVSHFGAAEKDPQYWEQSAKMLGLFQLTLRGTPFIYQGQEIGMTNFDFKSIDELNDVETKSIDRVFKKLFIPKFLRWKWIKASSRDNSRTPMQWDDSENAGFIKNNSGNAAPWLGINKNYKTINYESQKNNPESVLSFYKTLIQLRKNGQCLIYGEFVPLYADTKIMIYQRKMDGVVYTIALNFSSDKVFLNKIPIKTREAMGNIMVLSSCGRHNVKHARLDNHLLPWEGALLKEA